MATTTTTKTVQIIARISYKNNSKAVVYLVRSSNGVDTYKTTIYNGKATGCTCPATKPCYHMVQLQAREAARHEAAQAVKAAEQIVAEAAQTPEQAQIEAWVKQGVDRATAERVASAKGRKPVAYKGNLNGPREFSLFK